MSQRYATRISRITAKCLCGLAVMAAMACAPAEDPGVLAGTWRGEIEQNGEILPFTFEVEGGPAALGVTYINGDERVSVEQVRFDPASGTLELAFPSYSCTLAATVDGARMTGEVFLKRRNETHQLPFRAEHGLDYRFFPEPADEFADLAGLWDVEIDITAFGITQPGVAIFEQRGPYLTGTVNTQVGDYRFLTGEVRGRDLYLSTFDGHGTQVWRGHLDDEGTLSGRFNTVTYGVASWTARRNQRATLDDPTTLTSLKQDVGRLEFTFPDLEGRPVSLSDPQFQDKVVLVVISGSWCPTCHDEAQFMTPFYAENKDRGLEVIYLMFEYSDRFEDVEDQVRAFKARYGIEHDMLFAGDAARDGRNDLMPMLSGIMAFPTTIFVDRAGNVRRIHTAFPGPATSELHEEYKRDFRALVDELLAEGA